MQLPPHVRLVRDRNITPTRCPRISEPADMVKLLDHLLEEEQEVFVVLALDTKSRVIGQIEVTRGLLDASLVHPREVFRAAIVLGASGIILAHNHPSGDPTPSAEDKAVTRQLVAAGQLMDIPVYDHIIIGESGKYTSFATAGLL